MRETARGLHGFLPFANGRLVIGHAPTTGTGVMFRHGSLARLGLETHGGRVVEELRLLSFWLPHSSGGRKGMAIDLE